MPRLLRRYNLSQVEWDAYAKRLGSEADSAEERVKMLGRGGLEGMGKDGGGENGELGFGPLLLKE